MKHLFPGFLQKTLQLGLCLVLNFLFLYAHAQTVIFNEEFEQWTQQMPSLPQGWVLGANSCASSPACFWAQPTNFPRLSSPDSVGCSGMGGYARAYTTGMANGQQASMISPNIDLSNLGPLSNVQLSFCIINPNGGNGGLDQWGLSFSTDGGQSWQNQIQNVSVYSSWTPINLTIPPATRSNNFRMRFDARGGGDSFDIGIDAIKITQQSPACLSGNSMISSSLSGQVCRNHEIDISILSNDDTTQADYSYILTDALNRILGVLPASQVDLNFLPANDYRIYGISYSGNLDASPGQLIQNASASICHTLSSNFASFFVTDLNLDTQLSDYNGFHVSIDGGQDGSIEVLSPPSSNYSYNWSHDTSLTGPFQDQLGAGNYLVLVTDPITTCTNELTIELTSPTPLLGSIEVTTDYNGFPVSCFDSNDASLKAIIKGGVRPYRYVWQGFPTFGDSVLNNIGTGSYVLSVIDNNGALIQLQKQLLGPEEIILDNETEILFCFGESPEVSLEARGGAGSYTYLWANGSTDSTTKNQSPGLVSVNIQDDNGCAFDFDLELKEADKLVIDPIIGSPLCAEDSSGSILLFTDGGTIPYTFTWSDGSSDEDLLDLSAGVYQVEIKDQIGCELQQSFELLDPQAVEYNLETFPDNGNGDGSAKITILGGTAPFTFSWSNGDVGTVAKNLTEGSYTLVFSDASNCTQEISFEIERSQIASCLDIHMGFSPNGDGINDTFVIPCLDQYPDNEFQVINRWGQELYYTASYENNWEGTSNGKALAEGTYFYIVKFNSPDGNRVYKGSISIIK